MDCSNSQQQGRIQAADEVHRLLQRLRTLTDAGPTLERLQQLLPKLIQVCNEFSSRLRDLIDANPTSEPLQELLRMLEQVSRDFSGQ